MIDLLSGYDLKGYHEETYRNTATNHAAEIFADATWQITADFTFLNRRYTVIWLNILERSVTTFLPLVS